MFGLAFSLSLGGPGSSWMSTTTWRARSVNRSNSNWILPSVLGFYIVLGGLWNTLVTSFC